MLKNPHELLMEIATSYVGVHEVDGDNLGPEVELFQRSVDAISSREPWCMCFVQYCVKQAEIQSGRRSRIFRSESCIQVWMKSPPVLRRTKPSMGLIALWQQGTKNLGHAGLVVSPRKDGSSFESIEGNTSPGPWIDRDGDGVYEKTRHLKTPLGSLGGLHLLGFLDPFA